ncbi:MAG: hypothetical protein JOY60_14955 [Burkholderiaceae bacterium]|nr:hypothetical protein [Roseateles sp.]MBV8471147.1 hypothetical protein [Burkholderiaceae bacterium]
MKRRSLLKLGLGGAVVLAVAGTGIGLIRPGFKDGRMSEATRAWMGAVALALLDGAWPAPGPARDRALQAHLAALDQTMAGFTVPVRQELSQLFSLLNGSAGRLGLTGLLHDWSACSSADILAALDAMRHSGLALKQQAYHALRDLNYGVFFADPAHWSLMGYPGPREIA